MLIHTDNIHHPELFEALSYVEGPIDLEVQSKGSRKRARAFNVSLTWLGDKVKGDGRGRKNYGTSGGGWEMPYAATWDEWGEWIARLFAIDPDAIIGQYNGRDDFMRQTREALPWASQSKGAKAPWLDQA